VYKNRLNHRYLGSAVNVLKPLSIKYIPDRQMVSANTCKSNNIVNTNEMSENYTNILNALVYGVLKSGFYTYTLPANDPVFGTTNSITVCNWIGNQSIYYPSSSKIAYYYKLNDPENQTGNVTSANVITDQMFPSNSFAYYAPGQQPTYILGMVFPSSYNGSTIIKTEAVVSSRALTSS